MEKIISCSLDDLKTESDVEQKFITPLLLTSLPIGLNYNLADFRTKPSIKDVKIDKGGKKKQYYPDYVIIDTGLPLLVIEAKSPGEDLMEAYREARLYCGEINSGFEHNINPCHKILVTNGERSLCGFHDSDPKIELHFDDINAVDVQFSEFAKFLSRQSVFQYGKSILQKLRGNTRFLRPLGLLGGKTIQNEELKENSFGSTLSLEFRYLFNPESHQERKNIILHAYVKTKRHLRHVDPIDKIIRSTLPLGLSDIKKIEDTSQPVEVIRALRRKMTLKNKLLLLVGTVGSGKSTFTDYLKETAIDAELKNETVWISVNLNNAPLNRIEIYTWVKQELINQLKRQNNQTDFDDFANLKKIFSVEFNSFRKTYSSLLVEGSPEYNRRLADELAKLTSDTDTLANAYIRYLCSERGKLLIVVLDNSDKGNLQDQLLMFEVASWLKERFNCLVFLPIRDTTYDNFRKQPPLDTVIKDFVFRIDPPLLREVIFARIDYALRELDKGSTRLSFKLTNGMTVSYPASDQGFYLATIASSLFESTYFHRLVTGLAGRDIRRGLEVFLDFCKSGHLNATEILKIKQGKGQYIIPNHIISRIILRGSKKYYSDSNSNVKNLFYCSFDDPNPDPFVRLAILRLLKENFKRTGPTRNIGYHKAITVINELISYGHSQERLIQELTFLIVNKYIVTESQVTETFTLDELISISAAGTIILDLLNDINYLASCSEDIYYRESQIANDIALRCSERNGTSLYDLVNVTNNASDLIEYLIKYRSQFLIRRPDVFIKDEYVVNYTDLNKQLEIVHKYKEANDESTKQHIYKEGTKIEGEISGIQEYGIFIEFGFDSNGFVHISELEKTDIDLTELQTGDLFHAIVKRYNSKHKRFDLLPDTSEIH